MIASCETFMVKSVPLLLKMIIIAIVHYIISYMCWYTFDFEISIL